MIQKQDLTDSRGLAILAAFVAKGHFARHIPGIRLLYEARQNTLVNAVNEHLAGTMDISASNAGMHLVGWLGNGVAAHDFSTIARAGGEIATPLSAFVASRRRLNGVVMGYTAFRPDEILDAVRKIRSAIGG